MYDAVDRRDRRPAHPGRRRTGWSTSPPATTSASTSSRRSWTRSTPRSRRWGTHPSWSRLLGNPRLVPARSRSGSPTLLGAPDTLVLPTITPHPHVGDPDPRRPGHDLPRLAGAQDHLRRLRVRPGPRRDRAPVPRQRPRRTSRQLLKAAPPGTRLVVHGRRQQHDRQRPGPGRVRRSSAASTTRCSTSTTRTASASSASAPPTRPRPYGIARQRDRQVRRRVLRQHRAGRRLLQVVLVAAGVPGPADLAEEPPEGRRPAVPVLGPVADRVAGHRPGRPRRQRRSAATRSAPTCTARR